MCLIRKLINQRSIIDSYPRLVDDEALERSPSFCESSVSSDEDKQTMTSVELDKVGRTSQDVLVFRQIAEMMPTKSLLHLLQGMEHTANKSPEWTSSIALKERGRRVRFAGAQTGKAQCEVFEIPRISDPNLWWQSHEIKSIRSGCAALADHFRLYELDYVSSLQELMRVKCLDEYHTMDAMECISGKRICRGLESHILPDCRDNCKDHRRRVLETQNEVHECLEDCTAIGWQKIRHVSCQRSVVSKLLAYKLAQHDALQVMGSGIGFSDESSDVTDDSESCTERSDNE